MATHVLKTWPKPFEAVLEGRKTHELRRCDDRTFTVGDQLVLQEWQPVHEGKCEWATPTGIDFGSQAPLHAQCQVCYRKLDEPMPGAYTGREVALEVTYVSWEGEGGLPPGLAVLSVQRKGYQRVQARLIHCTECGNEYKEPYPGQSDRNGWVSYYESDPNGHRASPLIQLCSGCADKPFKLRFAR